MEITTPEDIGVDLLAAPGRRQRNDLAALHSDLACPPGDLVFHNATQGFERASSHGP